MDPVEASILKAAQDMGLTGLESVSTATRYRVYGNASADDVQRAARAILVNDTVQHVVSGEEEFHAATHGAGEAFHEPVVVELIDANTDRLMEISRKGGLSLNAEEMRRIQNHFRNLGRNPTDVELETLAQTWSEHCVHKTFKGKFLYTEGNAGAEPEVIDNLMRHTIMNSTR